MRKTGEIIDKINFLYHSGVMSRDKAISRLERIARNMNKHQIKKNPDRPKLYTAEWLLK